MEYDKGKAMLLAVLSLLVMLFSIFILNNISQIPKVSTCRALRLSEKPLVLLRYFKEFTMVLKLHRPGEEDSTTFLSCLYEGDEDEVYRCEIVGEEGCTKIMLTLDKSMYVKMLVLTTPNGNKTFTGFDAHMVAQTLFSELLGALRIYLCTYSQLPNYLKEELAESRDTQMDYEVKSEKVLLGGTIYPSIHVYFTVRSVDIRPVEGGEITLTMVKSDLWITTRYVLRDLAGRIVALEILNLTMR
ncbi:MAG: hypothetical protein DRO12_00080 [Thermoprotei archaeon]|nr:MAG: hypothetical protein DRO12_00080 [Thermoprotei archaeon]